MESDFPLRPLVDPAVQFNIPNSCRGAKQENGLAAPRLGLPRRSLGEGGQRPAVGTRRFLFIEHIIIKTADNFQVESPII